MSNPIRNVDQQAARAADRNPDERFRTPDASPVRAAAGNNARQLALEVPNAVHRQAFVPQAYADLAPRAPAWAVLRPANAPNPEQRERVQVRQARFEAAMNAAANELEQQAAEARMAPRTPSPAGGAPYRGN